MFEVLKQAMICPRSLQQCLKPVIMNTWIFISVCTWARYQENQRIILICYNQIDTASVYAKTGRIFQRLHDTHLWDQAMACLHDQTTTIWSRNAHPFSWSHKKYAVFIIMRNEGNWSSDTNSCICTFSFNFSSYDERPCKLCATIIMPTRL